MSRIVVKDLSAGYGFVNVLRDVSLEINSGEIVAFWAATVSARQRSTMRCPG